MALVNRSDGSLQRERDEQADGDHYACAGGGIRIAFRFSRYKDLRIRRGSQLQWEDWAMRYEPEKDSINACLLAVFLLTIAGGAIADQAETNRTIQVSGTGTDLLNSAIVYSKRPTASGVIQHGTEIVELAGDLSGKVLYDVTTVIDNQKGTLTNTGDQVFSGTIRGSEPVMLHDSRFRFEVNLATGAEAGSVYLFDHIAGPHVRCELKVAGTGKTADGNPTFSYTGNCRFGQDKPVSKN
jgi:hypothetical protein